MTKKKSMKFEFEEIRKFLKIVLSICIVLCFSCIYFQILIIRQVSWASLDRWGSSISESEKQVLGVINTSKDRMSSYNFDHVTTSLGPGASVQRFLEDAKKSFIHVFSYTSKKPDV